MNSLRLFSWQTLLLMLAFLLASPASYGHWLQAADDLFRAARAMTNGTFDSGLARHETWLQQAGPRTFRTVDGRPPTQALRDAMQSLTARSFEVAGGLRAQTLFAYPMAAVAQDASAANFAVNEALWIAGARFNRGLRLRGQHRLTGESGTIASFLLEGAILVRGDGGPPLSVGAFLNRAASPDSVALYERTMRELMNERRFGRLARFVDDYLGLRPIPRTWAQRIFGERMPPEAQQAVRVMRNDFGIPRTELPLLLGGRSSARGFDQIRAESITRGHRIVGVHQVGDTGVGLIFSFDQGSRFRPGPFRVRLGLQTDHPLTELEVIAYNTAVLGAIRDLGSPLASRDMRSLSDGVLGGWFSRIGDQRLSRPTQQHQGPREISTSIEFYSPGRLRHIGRFISIVEDYLHAILVDAGRMLETVETADFEDHLSQIFRSYTRARTDDAKLEVLTRLRRTRISFDPDFFDQFEGGMSYFALIFDRIEDGNPSPEIRRATVRAASEFLQNNRIEGRYFKDIDESVGGYLRRVYLDPRQDERLRQIAYAGLYQPGADPYITSHALREADRVSWLGRYRSELPSWNQRWVDQIELYLGGLTDAEKARVYRATSNGERLPIGVRVIVVDNWRLDTQHDLLALARFVGFRDSERGRVITIRTPDRGSIRFQPPRGGRESRRFTADEQASIRQALAGSTDLDLGRTEASR